MQRFAKPMLSVGFALVLAACGGLPESNEMRFDSDGDGRFSGSAGSDFTPEEIRTSVSNDICGGGAIVDFRVFSLSNSPEAKIFSGRCASGRRVQPYPINTYAAPAAQTSVPVTVGASGSSAGWDGSTPFVD
ncbi:hypothetical protein [Phaeobacter sp. HF9A]|uniref:hypothetical protein n=1 Tax=Phaeobacter sp. HF9A TaxID=2721561 RepID=UPI00142FCE1C|nr:hypothetical protein [Phaeobacter sp. HF9A]NIZ14163.1 hypothetical protein [Phaeobacter sp. HF9A]